MTARRFGLLAVASAFALVLCAGCSALKDAAEQVIENEAGCTEAQLGALNEPDLPHCSKAIACCKFIKGECGEIQLFTAPGAAVEACNINETVLSEILDEYHGISDGKCPPYLSEEACQDGVEKTRENFRKVVDEGDLSMAGANSPSCQLIVDETVNELNDLLGATAVMLPEACEAMDVTLPQSGIEDVTEDDTLVVDE